MIKNSKQSHIIGHMMLYAVYAVYGLYVYIIYIIRILCIKGFLRS